MTDPSLAGDAGLASCLLTIHFSALVIVKSRERHTHTHTQTDNSLLCFGYCQEQRHTHTHAHTHTHTHTLQLTKPPIHTAFSPAAPQNLGVGMSHLIPSFHLVYGRLCRRSQDSFFLQEEMRPWENCPFYLCFGENTNASHSPGQLSKRRK